ncbi:hypothetical protein GGS21DRAFT_21680 [Xylaria nigripes]|nr:hypothetical protein GGS21DRAFT_21680 [Xylaria nigripes]
MTSLEMSAIAGVMTGRRPSDTPAHSRSRSFGNVGRTFRASHIARRTIGIGLLLVTVFLWTASNFSTSYILSNQTYNKPFFMVYANTFFFALSAIPLSIRHVIQNGGLGHEKPHSLREWKEHLLGRQSLKSRNSNKDLMSEQRLLTGEEEEALEADGIPRPVKQLSFVETAIFSLKFSIIWFLGNYFSSACLQYTSVASVTILTSTSSTWTLILCAVMKIESFSTRKVMGVLASLAGVILISLVDLSSNDSGDDPGGLPHKPQVQVVIGDLMALFSAVFYGIYVVMMKLRIGNENRVNMPLFFGLVGAYNALSFWPLFPLLHYTGIERFELPPSRTIWAILLLNSLSCLISDISWSYAMLLTTPLVSTVGLSLTIPLSITGEMVHYGQYPSPMYWLGAAVVLMSFIFISQESHENAESKLAGLDGL